MGGDGETPSDYILKQGPYQEAGSQRRPGCAHTLQSHRRDLPSERITALPSQVKEPNWEDHFYAPYKKHRLDCRKLSPSDGHTPHRGRLRHMPATRTTPGGLASL